MDNGGDEDCVHRVLETAADVRAELEARQPHLIVGFPGVFTAQIARTLGIAHLSVLHGPYLWPFVELESPTPAESAVRDFAQRGMDNVASDLMHEIARELGMADLDYAEYLETEHILVPQPELPLHVRDNVAELGFVRASYGNPEPPPSVDLERSALISFGSGNPCDLTEVVAAARQVFPQVVVTGWRDHHGKVAPGVFAQGAIASSTFAGRVGAVISHGGIGTVGTFAEHGTPQVMVPTEIDQATMAIHAVRTGIAEQYGLEAWAEQPRLGRHLPPIDRDELAARLVRACESPLPPTRPSDGAADLADEILRAAAELEPAGRTPLVAG
jgi:hypothetical protein